MTPLPRPTSLVAQQAPLWVYSYRKCRNTTSSLVRGSNLLCSSPSDFHLSHSVIVDIWSPAAIYLHGFHHFWGLLFQTPWIGKTLGVLGFLSSCQFLLGFLRRTQAQECRVEGPMGTPQGLVRLCLFLLPCTRGNILRPFPLRAHVHQVQGHHVWSEVTYQRSQW